MIRARAESSLRSSELKSLFQLSYGSLLVKHGDTCARERHQLIGYQVDEHIRHRAVERLEGEPSQVLTPLRGILGTRSVGKPAMKLWRRQPARSMSMLRTVSS